MHGMHSGGQQCDLCKHTLEKRHFDRHNHARSLMSNTIPGSYAPVYELAVSTLSHN